MISIKFVDQISEKTEAKMRDDLVAYELSHGIYVNYKRFSLVLNNEHNETIGVLNAYTAFAEIYIDDMWVDSKHRLQGLGKKLIETLENHFQGKGFNNINLCTNQFNAPKFYQKCGFIAEFTRKNLKNPKLSKTFFVKYFDDEIQTQGIVNTTKE
jgi:ribosomal protein S18 acetylase RimI-like enzyme